MSQALEVREPEVETRAVVTPMAMIDRALAMNANPETLGRLLALQERWEANEARKAFDEALAAAKAEIPVIVKNRQVGYAHKDQRGETSYRHEDLGEIARTIDPILGKHGLSYRFRTTSELNQPISVTCIVSHRKGHSEQNTLLAGRDDSGKKNSIQQIGSTITYLQRYTLKAALGLAAAHDDDGGKADDTSGPVSDEQAAELRKMADDAGADVPRLCAFLKIDSLPDLPAARFEQAVAAIKAKARQKGGAK